MEYGRSSVAQKISIHVDLVMHRLVLSDHKYCDAGLDIFCGRTDVFLFLRYLFHYKF